MSIVQQACTQMELSEPAAALLQADMGSEAAVQKLMNAGHPQDALKLLARLLPKRYAVAWLCQCARTQVLNHEDKAGAILAEKWVREPNEGNRRAAFEFANAGGYKSLGTWFAAAAGWSSGSLAPEHSNTPVAPAEHLTAAAAVAAINLLAALVKEEFEARRLHFMSQALSLLGSGENAPARGA